MGSRLSEEDEMLCRRLITATPDYPKKGVTFLDVHPLLCNASGLSCVVHTFAAQFEVLATRHKGSFFIAGLDARGFTIGAAVAHALGVGFCMLRKKGKLPPPVLSVRYSLEYGDDSIEVPETVFDGVASPVVVLLDDLVATGGTMAAACELVEKARGHVLQCATLIEIRGLGGRERISTWCDDPLMALLEYDD